MVRDKSPPEAARQLPVARQQLWEGFLSQIRGERDAEEIASRTIRFLMEAYHPEECFLALSAPPDGVLRVTSWCPSPNAKARSPSVEEERRLIRRWGETMGQVLGHGRIWRCGEGEIGDAVLPVLAPGEGRGVMVLRGLDLRSIGPTGVRAMEGIADELGERLALVGGMSRSRRSGEGEGSDLLALGMALEETRRRVRELESSEEKRAEEIQRLTERWISVRMFNESVLQSLSSGLISVDGKGRITYMNRGAERILQYSVDEVLGKPLSFAMASKDRRDLLVIRSEEEELSMGRQIRVMRKDGVEIPIGFTVSSHLDADGHEIGRILHFRDLTKINAMQEELLRMDRLASLGEISMGIAHEIRNPLAGIRITAQAMEEEAKDNELLREYVFRITSEIDRLNALLMSFFSFAKPQEPKRVQCHIPDLIADVLSLLGEDLRERQIRAEQAHAQALPAVSVDIDQMKLAFLNLFLNAIQAISGEGWIRVGTNLGSLHGCRGISISISDTGKGILPEHQSKVFNPFFTTKAKGLGLGLSITYQIVKRHGGSIRVQSERGKGSTFVVHLPLDEDKTRRSSGGETRG